MAGLQAYNALVAQSWSENNNRYAATNVWSYFTKPDSIVVAPNLLVRKDFDFNRSTNFIHLGRNRNGINCSAVSFSKHEGRAVRSLITKLLTQRTMQIEQGKHSYDIVITVNGKEIAKSSEDVTKRPFWDSNAESLASIKMKVSFNQLVGDYQLSILVPVSPEISVKHRGWAGPLVTLSAPEMEKMEEYFDNLYEL